MLWRDSEIIMARTVIIALMATGVVALGGIGYLSVARMANADTSANSAGHDTAKPFLMERSSGVDLAPLKAAAGAQPDNAAASATLGMSALSQSDFATARGALEQSLARNPNQPKVWSALGETYVHLERSNTAQMPPRARAAFDKALLQNPRDLRARFYTALEKDFRGQHDAAIGEWLAMLSQVPRGSHPDSAIRAAIKASVKNNAVLIRRAMDNAIRAQPIGNTALPQQTD